MSKRIDREKRTASIMIGMYCKKHHAMNGRLCDSCKELDDYALKRVANCQFDENKPVCSICPVHCYATDKRKEIREVMQYSGPRMLYKHPCLALMYVIDKNMYKL